jgi:hypothetical protein
LNSSFFTSGVGTNAQYWWSGEPRADDTNRMWAANAGGGIGPHLKTETLSSGGTNRYHVRLVRGAPAPNRTPLHNIVDNGNGTITDLDTGLTWQQAEVVATIDWTNALNYAESLVLGGYQDWRLPNVKELQSINDATRINPSVDTNKFPGAKIARYWTSTSQVNQPARAWFMDFQFGIASQDAKTSPYWVRAVRGGLSNTPPVLAGVANRAVNAGVTVQITNVVTDAQTAPGFLTFSLLTSSSNASLGASSGIFTWRPAVAQAGTTNLFTVVVADSGSPILNATQTFLVTVNPLTNPPAATAMSLVGNQLLLRINGDAGPDYLVQASTNLNTWTNLFLTNSPTLPFFWSDPDAGSFTSRFYRVIIGP